MKTIAKEIALQLACLACMFPVIIACLKVGGVV
jgi:hypothetical protein